MKRYLVFSLFFLLALLFYRCGASRKVAGIEPVPALTYASAMEPVIAMHCGPCHIPSKGGNKKAYDNYENVKQDIDEIIRRIELQPGARGFMPFKRARLSDSTIAVFRQWKTDGLLEK